MASVYWRLYKWRPETLSWTTYCLCTTCKNISFGNNAVEKIQNKSKIQLSLIICLQKQRLNITCKNTSVHVMQNMTAAVSNTVKDLNGKSLVHHNSQVQYIKSLWNIILQILSADHKFVMKEATQEYGRGDQPVIYKGINTRGRCGSDSKLGALTSDGDVSIAGEEAVWSFSAFSQCNEHFWMFLCVSEWWRSSESI